MVVWRILISWSGLSARMTRRAVPDRTGPRERAANRQPVHQGSLSVARARSMLHPTLETLPLARLRWSLRTRQVA